MLPISRIIGHLYAKGSPSPSSCFGLFFLLHLGLPVPSSNGEVNIYRLC